MITINKGVTNSTIFTLTEKSTLPTPNYLFSFTNDNSGVNTLFNMVDTSAYPRRYNGFDLVETSVTNPSLGQVDLEYGWGTYEVYEAVTATLSVSGTTGLVLEEGKYFVSGYPVNYSSEIDNIYL